MYAVGFKLQWKVRAALVSPHKASQVSMRKNVCKYVQSVHVCLQGAHDNRHCRDDL